jgi:preprotein translocase subunit SecG
MKCIDIAVGTISKIFSTDDGAEETLERTTWVVVTVHEFFIELDSA